MLLDFLTSYSTKDYYKTESLWGHPPRAGFSWYKLKGWVEASEILIVIQVYQCMCRNTSKKINIYAD